MTAAPDQGMIGRPEPRCRWVCDAQRPRQEQEQQMLRGEQGALQAQEAVRARQRQLQEQEQEQEQEAAGGR
ncbi:hypothetical protein [Actinomadura sp. HBU206391]|uniref:hypothetical protein n=1 Tax=Actinomadura sp. HBU206391 TaxID=2731692 RepID=UPI00164F60AE|nr:hypothetical protein [Actinomadura sp. HBU206391]MBC6461081.1 hypothetical protein [Actinomadura sp. HBU206391]